jgi:hypothetical protein
LSGGDCLVDAEEKKLQIKLAQLQADLQIWLTMCFGGIAVFISMVIASWQEFLSTPESQALLKISLFVTMLIGFVGMIIITSISTRQMKIKRSEMNKL